MKCYSLLFGLCLFFLFATLVSATDIGLEVNNNIQSIDLEHRATIRIPILVRNFNTVCNVQCTVDVEGQTQTFAIADQSTKTVYYSFTAPNKGTDSKRLGIEAYCYDSASTFVCDGNDEAEKTLTINIQLTAEEKEAKLIVERFFSSILRPLEDLEVSLGRLESQFNDLADNVKISDLKTEFNELKQVFSSATSLHRNIKSYYEDEEYIIAKSYVDNSVITKVANTEQKTILLQDKLDDRIKEHNEVIESLNSLRNNILDLVDLAAGVGKKQEYDSLMGEVDSLVNYFESGEFNTYEEMRTKVIDLNLRITNKKQSWEAVLKEKVVQGVMLLDAEYIQFCDKKSVCGLTHESISQNIEGFNKLCISLKELTSEYDNKNQQDFEEYEELKANLDKIKQTIDDNKERIISVNKISNNIEETYNKFAINTSIKECNFLIDTFNSKIVNYDNSEVIKSLNKIKIGCSGLQNEVQIQANEKNTIFFKIKRIFSFFKSKNNIKLNRIKTDFKDIKAPTNIILQDSTSEFISSFCQRLKATTTKNSLDTITVDKNTAITNTIDTSLEEKEGQCCVFGKCTTCCKDEDCKNDPKTYPVIFVHGHAPYALMNDLGYSIKAFESMQNKFEKWGYIDEGVIIPDELPQINTGEWGKFSKPITIRTTYYLEVYDKNGNPTGKRDTGKSINTYANRLKTVVAATKRYTGKDKVIIIAHSMGGLVSREYIAHFGGNEDVYKLITIGTPNQGIHGIGISGLCGVGNLATIKECQEMRANSEFLERLNEDETPPNTQYLTIAGKANYCNLVGYDCIEGDGVVRTSSVILDGAQNEIIEKESDNSGFHSKLLSMDETHNIIKSFLD